MKNFLLGITAAVWFLIGSIILFNFVSHGGIQGSFDAVWRHWHYAESGALQRWQESQSRDKLTP